MPKVKRKICTKCEKSYPATSEYYHRRSSNKIDGLHNECRVCRLARQVIYDAKRKALKLTKPGGEE